MKVKSLHSWQLSTSQAKEIQRRLAKQVLMKSEDLSPRYIAGVDISTSRVQGTASGAVVVLKYPEMTIIETQVARSKLDFPYIPGFLSFRELPLTIAAFEMLNITPDLVMVDGQGIAHPRRLGLASHLGLFLDIPTIGCAKSLLCGSHREPGTEPGSYAEVLDKDETIGAALRTKRGEKPVYVSIGHRIDLQTAIHRVMESCRGYRLPEPTRLAHQAAGTSLRQEKETAAHGLN
ncbi:deoxyribonuclease V [Chloroflexota bacterium]